MWTSQIDSKTQQVIDNGFNDPAKVQIRKAGLFSVVQAEGLATIIAFSNRRRGLTC